MNNRWQPGWEMIVAIVGLLTIILTVIVEWDKLRQSTILNVLLSFVQIVFFTTIWFAINGLICGLVIKDPTKIVVWQYLICITIIIPLTRWLGTIFGLGINVDIYLKSGLINWVFLFAVWGVIFGVILRIIGAGNVTRERSQNIGGKDVGI